MIVDASVLLRAFLPDESQPHALAVVRDHVSGKIKLKAPTLLIYELSNAVWQAERRGRIDRHQTVRILQSFANLDIEVLPQAWGEMLPMARLYERSAYDAAYLILAEQSGERFITGDLRLYHAVHKHLDWVLWLEDYPVEAVP
jgi:predicted nucleic acid-binding protein